MHKALLALLTTALLVHASIAAPPMPADFAKPVIQFIDAFNIGDLKSAYATFATGDLTIVDEFAPNLWIGPQAPQQWAADYDRHAQAFGVTDGKVTYGAPTRIEISSSSAHVILPTVYLYKEHGKPIQEEGSVTAVLRFEHGAWKMRGWTWSGVKPHPSK
jgi:hypothetical protein